MGCRMAKGICLTWYANGWTRERTTKGCLTKCVNLKIMIGQGPMSTVGRAHARMWFVLCGQMENKLMVMTNWCFVIW